MRETKIMLKSIDDVKNFVQTVTCFDGEFEVASGKYVVDAKSILGLFSIDLSNPVSLRIDTKESLEEDVLKAIEAYRV